MSINGVNDIGKVRPISVVTVVYNGVGSIAETIDSVLGQDYPNVEYIVVDGGSADGTRSVIDKYRSQIDRYVSENDDGVYDAMNKALRMASGEFILFMNCGDVFASSGALTSAMQFAEADGEQVIFGGWIRRQVGRSPEPCRPIIAKGIFNHQAVIYSRSIHTWHGEYVNVSGLTTADYLFFATLLDSDRVTRKVIEPILAIIDTNGLSSGPQTLRQKLAIDFLCGRASMSWLLMVFLLHPIYRRVKAVLRRLA